MASEQMSLRNLVESRAARHALAPRTLWEWALDAIAHDAIAPILPSGKSLDTEFYHGGAPLTWRQVVIRTSTDGYNPSDSYWTQTLIFDAVMFDKWLESALKRNGAPVHPKRTAGAKRKTSREELASFIPAKYGWPLPAGITNKRIALDYEAETENHVSERTVGRALGRK